VTNENKDWDLKRCLVISFDTKIVVFLRTVLVNNTKWASRDQLLTAVHKAKERLHSLSLLNKYNIVEQAIRQNEKISPNLSSLSKGKRSGGGGN